MNANKLGNCPTCDHPASIFAPICLHCGETHLHEIVERKSSEDPTRIKCLVNGSIIEGNALDADFDTIFLHIHRNIAPEY